MSWGVYVIMRRCKGMSLQDVLNLYTTQYSALMDWINYELNEEEKALKKARKK